MREYQKYGQEALAQKLAAQLTAAGEKPYIIPVGGSNGLGTWGYVACVEEILQQCSSQQDSQLPSCFTDIVLVRVSLRRGVEIVSVPFWTSRHIVVVYRWFVGAGA